MTTQAESDRYHAAADVIRERLTIRIPELRNVLMRAEPVGLRISVTKVDTFLATGQNDDEVVAWMAGHIRPEGGMIRASFYPEMEEGAAKKLRKELAARAARGPMTVGPWVPSEDEGLDAEEIAEMDGGPSGWARQADDGFWRARVSWQDPWEWSVDKPVGDDIPGDPDGDSVDGEADSASAAREAADNELRRMYPGMELP